MSSLKNIYDIKEESDDVRIKNEVFVDPNNYNPSAQKEEEFSHFGPLMEIKSSGVIKVEDENVSTLECPIFVDVGITNEYGDMDIKEEVLEYPTDGIAQTTQDEETLYLSTESSEMSLGQNTAKVNSKIKPRNPNIDRRKIRSKNIDRRKIRSKNIDRRKIRKPVLFQTQELAKVIPCEHCDFSFIDIMDQLKEDPLKTLAFLLAHKLIRYSRECPKCGKNLILNPKECMFRCCSVINVRVSAKKYKKVRCRFSASIFENTFFSKTNLPRYKVLALARLFLYPNFKVEYVQHNLKISPGTIADWSSFCREVCEAFMFENSEKLGGKDKIVEIYEAKFSRSKFNVDSCVSEKWVFGGIEVGSKNTFLVPVEQRDKETLISLIKEWVELGTTIISDCLKEYRNISLEGYTYQRVNHSKNFVDPGSSVHTGTQNIEQTWHDARANVPKNGNQKPFIVGYLARHLFLKKFTNEGERFHQFLLAAADLYKPSV